MYLFENDIETLNNTKYFYRGLIKVYSNKTKKEITSFSEHEDYPRIPYLNPFYKSISLKDDGNININMDLFNNHTDEVDFDELEKSLYSPKSYLYRYSRFKTGNYDEDDEMHGLEMVGYKRSSEYIPDLKESLKMAFSINVLGDITTIYLYGKARVLYKTFLHREMKDDHFDFIYYKNLYEGLFLNKDTIEISRFIPYEKGPLKVHGSDGSGNFCNIYYQSYLKFIFKRQEQ